MKRSIIVLFLVMLLLVPVACAAPPGAPSGVAPLPAPAPMPSEKDEGFAPGTLPSTEERMIVRTGDMSLVVQDVVDTRNEIAQLAIKYDGYVVSSQISGEEQEMRGYISIRVPDDKFESALAELREPLLALSTGVCAKG